MLKVLVRRVDLAKEKIPVHGSFIDEVPPEMLRPEFTVLSVGSGGIRQGPLLPELAPNWREGSVESVAQGEAERRIAEVFPEHEQRYAALEFGLLAARGAKGNSKRFDEIERLWNYLNAVRQVAARMETLPPDPTSDSHWPKRP